MSEPVSNELTPEKVWTGWQAKFLRELAKTGNVSAACRKGKISRTYAYRIRDEDKEFKAAWEEALVVATEALELEARRRAEAGTREDILYLGKRVGTVRHYSDTLMIFLLKAHMPEKYRDNYKVEHTGKDGKDLPIATPVVVILPDNGRNDRN